MNHMTVTKMWHFDSEKPLDLGDENDLTDKKPDTATLRIMRIGNIANNGRLSSLHSPTSASVASREILTSTQDSHGSSSDFIRSRWVGQPTDVAMLDLVDRFREHDVREGLGPRIGETPFSSERKWMGVTIRSDSAKDVGQSSHAEKEIAYIKGALDRILARCDTYITSEGREVVLDNARKEEAMLEAGRMAAEGLRVLGFASGPVPKSLRSKPQISTPRSTTPVAANNVEAHVSHDEDVYKGLTFAGIVGMSDPPRPDVAKSIRKLLKGGVRVIMITGDAEETAVAIANKLGMIVAPVVAHTASTNAVKPVLTGHDIDEMTDDELTSVIARTSIFARTSPEHKMRIVGALQTRGDIVAMTGDGVNDAPALKKADIGISMGLMGTDVAKEAADMILTDDDFSTILHAIEEGKGIFNNIQNFLTFQLSTSAAALTLVFLCTCLGYSNPLNAMQILWISKPSLCYHGLTLC
jgi:Ca2+-transporting ATPase